MALNPKDKYLIQDGPDGHLYPYTDLLAERPDMKPYEVPPIEEVPAPVADAAPTAPVAPPVLTPNAPDPRIDSIVEAIKGLTQADYTATGTPKVDALSLLLGITVTAEERDTAWERHLNAEAEAK